MADLMKVSNITYMKYENGETEPKFSQMIEIVNALGAGIKDIFKDLETTLDEALMYNMKRTEILNDDEKECLNQMVEALLIKHQIESVQRNNNQKSAS